MEGDWAAIVGVASVVGIGVGGNIESETKSNCGEEHFNANEEVLPSSGDCSTSDHFSSFGIVNRVDRRSGSENSNEESLPERQEDDTLDSQELENRAIWAEKVASCCIKQEHSVEGERDRDVIDQRDVDVSLIEAPVAILVLSNCSQHQCDDSHDWFDEAELESCLLAESKELDRVLLAGQAAGAR